MQGVKVWYRMERILSLSLNWSWIKLQKRRRRKLYLSEYFWMIGPVLFNIFLLSRNPVKRLNKSVKERVTQCNSDHLIKYSSLKIHTMTLYLPHVTEHRLTYYFYGIKQNIVECFEWIKYSKPQEFSCVYHQAWTAHLHVLIWTCVFILHLLL